MIIKSRDDGSTNGRKEIAKLVSTTEQPRHWLSVTSVSGELISLSGQSRIYKFAFVQTKVLSLGVRNQKYYSLFGRLFASSFLLSHEISVSCNHALIFPLFPYQPKFSHKENSHHFSQSNITTRSHFYTLSLSACLVHCLLPRRIILPSFIIFFFSFGKNKKTNKFYLALSCILSANRYVIVF